MIKYVGLVYFEFDSGLHNNVKLILVHVWSYLVNLYVLFLLTLDLLDSIIFETTKAKISLWGNKNGGRVILQSADNLDDASDVDLDDLSADISDFDFDNDEEQVAWLYFSLPDLVTDFGCHLIELFLPSMSSDDFS